MIDLKQTIDYKDILNKDNFKSISTLCENDFPLEKGIYIFVVDKGESLPQVFSEELNIRGHNILYIGFTDKTLRERVWNDELRFAKKTAFLMYLGTMLGFTPPAGSLNIGERNYRFTEEDENKILDWMKLHLLVNFIVDNNDLATKGEELIKMTCPLLNMLVNPNRMKELVEMKRKCCLIGWGSKRTSIDKHNLVKRISDNTNVPYKTALLIVEKFMSTIKKEVGNGEQVSIRGFGTFMNVLRHEKNFHATPGKIIVIPEHYEVTLKFSNEIKNAVK